jgi:hypothetical protein
MLDSGRGSLSCSHSKVEISAVILNSERSVLIMQGITLRKIEGLSMDTLPLNCTGYLTRPRDSAHICASAYSMITAKRMVIPSLK